MFIFKNIWHIYDAKNSNPIKWINKTNQNYGKYISLEKILRPSIIEEAKFEARPTFDAKYLFGANFKDKIWDRTTLRPGQANGARPDQVL